jgi:hypothetical protein
MYTTNKTTQNPLERPFARMGARVQFEDLVPDRWTRVVAPVVLDVRRDKQGEFFLVRQRADVTLEVLDVQPSHRHLLLLTRAPDSNGGTKARFLLGHDERHWFVAAIPEGNPVSTVSAARQALKPEQVVLAEHGIRTKSRERRVNKARARQGEWFFVPRTNFAANPRLILRNEPLVRGRGSKPHLCQELYREGGETVYVNRQYPNGLTQAQFARLGEKVRSQAGWRTMVRNPRVLVRGTVRHSDHKTILLNGWHEVFMNTENRAAAMRHVAFLD